MLSERQKRFVAEYIIDLNGTQAAIRTGYSERSAYSQAERLLRNDEIAAAIQVAIAERNERLKASGDEVVIWWTDVLRTDMTQVASWGPEGVIVRESDELSEAQRKAVRKVKMKRTRKTYGYGENAVDVEEIEVEVELIDQRAVSELLAKHRGLLLEKVEHSGGVTWEIVGVNPEDV